MKAPWLVLAMAVVMAGRAQSEDSGLKPATATVRAVNGEASYRSAGGDWDGLKVGAALGPGTEIRTGAESTADLSVNGVSSVVRVTAGTDLELTKLFMAKTADGYDRETMLELKSGRILGNVKKISGNSRYEVVTPYGVMGIRGTDYEVTVETNAELVTFTCITGQCICATEPKGQGRQMETRILNTGETFTYRKKAAQGKGAGQ